jgi:hypothetical protein
VNDGGASVRFNFPAAARFRTISWEEWFESFDREGLLFIYEAAKDGQPPSQRFRFVRGEREPHEPGMLRKLLDRVVGG